MSHKPAIRRKKWNPSIVAGDGIPLTEPYHNHSFIHWHWHKSWNLILFSGEKKSTRLNLKNCEEKPKLNLQNVFMSGNCDSRVWFLVVDILSVVMTHDNSILNGIWTMNMMDSSQNPNQINMECSITNTKQIHRVHSYKCWAFDSQSKSLLLPIFSLFHFISTQLYSPASWHHHRSLFMITFGIFW